METQSIKTLSRGFHYLSRKLQNPLPASNFCFLILARFSGLLPCIYVLLVLDFPAIPQKSPSFLGKPRT
jgi:hypothetical protein